MTPRRIQLCTFCKKHAIRIGIKNHIRNCPYKTCRCKCCEETRICQRFNRANTKNSRKPVGERTLTLPLELIELLGFEKRILDVVKGIREFCGTNNKKFEEFMFKWIEKGFDITNHMQITNNNNNLNVIQKHSSIPSGLSIEPIVTSNGYHQTENCTFMLQNGYIDENFYDSINGYEMKSYGYSGEQQMMRNRDSHFEVTELKFTPIYYPSNPIFQVPDMIWNEDPIPPTTDGLVNNLAKNGSHLIELKTFSDKFHASDFKKISSKLQNTSGSPQLPDFHQTFESKQ